MTRPWAAIHTMICATLVLAWQGASTPLHAHPHVWVTVEAEVVYNDKQAVSAFRHQWKFDEFYSSFAIQGLDKNGDGKYTREELQELAEVNVQSLRDFGYFTFPKLSGNLLDRKVPQDYWIEYDGTILTLSLTIPLEQTVSADQVKDLTLGIYDPTFYVDFALASEEPVRLAGAPQGCAPVVNDPDPADTEFSVSGLGETFFNELEGNSELAEKYAKKISISCPAS